MKKLGVFLAAFAIAALSGCVEYSLAPVAVTATQNGTFVVDVSLNHCVTLPYTDLSWCSDTSDVYGVAFDLNYDPAVVRFSSISVAGSVLSSVTATTGFRNSATDNGKLVVAVTKQGQVAGQQGEGKIAGITFTAYAPGTTTLSFNDPHLVDSAGEFLVGWPAYAASLNTASVTVTP